MDSYWNVQARLDRLQGLTRPRRVSPLVSVTGQKPASVAGMYSRIRKPRHDVLLKQVSKHKRIPLMREGYRPPYLG
jgi:hypothetical protein